MEDQIFRSKFSNISSYYIFGAIQKILSDFIPFALIQIGRSILAIPKLNFKILD